ncbi:MAG: FAD synthetase family protein [Firmicutes bacterium]|nr:FAD synthetase family protein [Bacillota bacterium]
MKIYDSFHPKSINEPVCLALGNFDGVHAGHRRLMGECTKLARQKQLEPAVFTFDSLTANAVAGKIVVKRLMSPALKAIAIEETGIRHMISVPFERSTMELSPRAFFNRLLECVNVRAVICGFNYRFGYKAAGDTALLASLCAEKGVELCVIPAYTVDGTTVSSTLLRTLIAKGDLKGYCHYSGSTFAIGKDGLQLKEECGLGQLRCHPRLWQVLPPEGTYKALVCTGFSKDAALVTVGAGEEPLLTVSFPEGDAPLIADTLRRDFFTILFLQEER